jgi:hypothetical protein
MPALHVRLRTDFAGGRPPLDNPAGKTVTLDYRGMPMTITLDLQPDIERGLLSQATARGLSLSDFVKEIVVREAHVVPEPLPRRTGQELIDACAKVRGLLADQEIDTLFSRNPSFARPVYFE